MTTYSGGSIDPFALIAGNLIDQTFDGLHSIGHYLTGQYKDSHYDGRGFENYNDRVGTGINGLLLAAGPLLKGMPALNYADDAEILIKNSVGAAAAGYSKRGTESVFHYTSKEGYKAIMSGKDLTFKVMGNSKNGRAVWFTTDSPEFLRNHGPGAFKDRIGITRAKSEYFFEIDASAFPPLRRLRGGRGDHILFSEEHIIVPKSSLLKHGLTPKR